jgi:catechol 2,3-dioxygenase-like lactoylglutathione lyase family enzyme
MKIYVTSVFVDDQAKALEFYTEKLGFKLKQDIPLGSHRWLTVVSQEDESGVEMLLEPSEHPAAKPFQQALMEDGIPFTSFQVADLQAEYARLESLGVKFTQPPTHADRVVMAVLNDTCGNLIQLIQLHPEES